MNDTFKKKFTFSTIPVLSVTRCSVSTSINPTPFHSFLSILSFLPLSYRLFLTVLTGFHLEITYTSNEASTFSPFPPCFVAEVFRFIFILIFYFSLWQRQSFCSIMQCRESTLFTLCVFCNFVLRIFIIIGIHFLSGVKEKDFFFSFFENPLNRTAQ